MANRVGKRPRSRRLLAALAVVGAAVLVACWWQWATPAPAVIEDWYVRGLYLKLLALTVPITEKVPFSLTELMLAVLIVSLLARAIVLLVRARQRRVTWTAAFGRLLLLGATVGAALYLGFVALWGLCYARAPLEARLDWRIDHRDADVVRLTRQLIARARADRATLSRAEVESLDAKLAQAVAEVTFNLDHYRPRLPRRVKRVWPPRLLAITGTTGVTSPWLHEAQIDPTLLTLEQPFTIAHELAHVAGYAAEAEANLVGYLACMQVDVPAVRYAAQLALLPAALASLPDDLCQNALAELPADVRRDLEAIVERARRDRSKLLTKVSLKLYDIFLRNQGVAKGVRDYDRVIELLIAFNAATS